MKSLKVTPDVILVSSTQKQVRLVWKVTHSANQRKLSKERRSFENIPPATVDVPHHVLDSVEVQVRDDDLVALALPHIVLEHCTEHRRPESSINL